ncbi:CbtB domain-containing protein [Natronomonas salina]|uniref:CbtB domain-containing protein n=1 Tax=Natronomonas salina TaxID=1710540 RepID=UPI001FE4A756|nr:CbtB domain-containing protein [Natronomonas salina]
MSDRIDTARATLSPTQVGLGLLGITLALFLLAFAQEPLVHDAMHNGRHVAGVVCH